MSSEYGFSEQSRDAMRLPVAPVEGDGVRPILSVVIPTFRNREYAPIAVASVLGQLTREKAEVFVLDDASPDGDPLQDSEWVGQVPVFRQESNLGHTKNLTDGIRRARGKFVHILHGDDFVLPGFYDAILETVDKFPSIAAVFTQNAVVNERGQWVGVSELLRSGTGIVPDLLKRLAVQNVLETPSIVVARKAYEELGAFDDQLSWTEDWEMWARIAARFPVAYVDRPLAAYRKHGASSTARHVAAGSTGEDSARALNLIWSYLSEGESSEVTRSARNIQAIRCIGYARSAPNRAAMVRQLKASIGFSTHPRHLARVVLWAIRLGCFAEMLRPTIR